MSIAADLALALDPAVLMEHAGMPPDPWQIDLLRSSADRVMLLCSRQSGKSTTTAVLALHEALFHPHSLVLLVSPSQRQSGELFKKVVAIYRSLPSPPQTLGDSATKLELENGSRILGLPGNEETVRGFSGARLIVIDEASRVPTSLYIALRPMLAVSRGRLIALTTPWGRRGWFHAAWTSNEPWHRIQVPATDCPRISRAFLEEEEKALGTRSFLQEYMTEFVEVDDAVFLSEDIDAALDPHLTPLFPMR